MRSAFYGARSRLSVSLIKCLLQGSWTFLCYRFVPLPPGSSPVEPLPPDTTAHNRRVAGSEFKWISCHKLDANVARAFCNRARDANHARVFTYRSPH